MADPIYVSLDCDEAGCAFDLPMTLCKEGVYRTEARKAQFNPSLIQKSVNRCECHGSCGSCAPNIDAWPPDVAGAFRALGRRVVAAKIATAQKLAKTVELGEAAEPADRLEQFLAKAKDRPLHEIQALAAEMLTGDAG